MGFSRSTWAVIFAVLPIVASGIEIGEPIPKCPMQSLAKDTPVSVPQLQGKVLYVDFWASWCGPCAQSLPFMSQLQAELKGKGLQILAVNLDEDAKDAEKFLAANPVQLDFVTAPEGKCPELYGVQAMPTSFLIDRKGKVRHIHSGFRPTDKDEIRSKILALLDEK